MFLTCAPISELPSNISTMVRPMHRRYYDLCLFQRPRILNRIQKVQIEWIHINNLSSTVKDASLLRYEMFPCQTCTKSRKSLFSILIYISDVWVYRFNSIPLTSIPAQRYGMSKKSCPNSYGNIVYEIGQDIFGRCMFLHKMLEKMYGKQENVQIMIQTKYSMIQFDTQICHRHRLSPF